MLTEPIVRSQCQLLHPARTEGSNPMSRDEICLSYWLCLTLPVILDHLHDAPFEPEVEETLESLRCPLHSLLFWSCMHRL
jgi:hypothetical protein